jgi:hypothetical protein
MAPAQVPITCVRILSSSGPSRRPAVLQVAPLAPLVVLLLVLVIIHRHGPFALGW